MEKDQSIGCVCLCSVMYLCWQAFVVWAQLKRVTDEQGDVGIFPSALLLLLLICVTGLVLTVKYHTLVADSNRAYSHSCDLITLQPRFH